MGGGKDLRNGPKQAGQRLTFGLGSANKSQSFGINTPNCIHMHCEGIAVSSGYRGIHMLSQCLINAVQPRDNAAVSSSQLGMKERYVQEDPPPDTSNNPDHPKAEARAITSRVRESCTRNSRISSTMTSIRVDCHHFMLPCNFQISSVLNPCHKQHGILGTLEYQVLFGAETLACSVFLRSHSSSSMRVVSSMERENALTRSLLH